VVRRHVPRRRRACRSRLHHLGELIGLRRFWSELNPSVRGFLIIGLIALAVVVLNLSTALASLYVIARIAFLLAIAFFVYLVWRERREEIGAWPGRARLAFYGAALLILADVIAFSLFGASGFAAAGFLLVLILCGFAMFRVWRDQRTYGY
jgi:small-conductance mechanosensitive channel